MIAAKFFKNIFNLHWHFEHSFKNKTISGSIWVEAKLLQPKIKVSSLQIYRPSAPKEKKRKSTSCFLQFVVPDLTQYLPDADMHQCCWNRQLLNIPRRNNSTLLANNHSLSAGHNYYCSLCCYIIVVFQALDRTFKCPAEIAWNLTPVAFKAQAS